MKKAPKVLGLLVVLVLAACAATEQGPISSDGKAGTVTFLYRDQAGEEALVRSPPGHLLVRVVAKWRDGCSDPITMFLDALPGSRFRVLAHGKGGEPVGSSTRISRPASRAGGFWEDALVPWLMIPIAVYGSITDDRCSNPSPDCCAVWIEDADSGATAAGSPPWSPAPPPSWSPGDLPPQPPRGDNDDFVNCVVNGRRGWTYRSYCDP